MLEWALFGNAVINILAFVGFITTIQLAGPIFASQTGYIVTISGVIWGMVLFGETHSGWVWMSLLVMIIGPSLVSPRHKPERRGNAGKRVPLPIAKQPSDIGAAA